MRLRLAFASVLSAAGLLALAPAADAYKGHGFKGHGYHGGGYYGGGYYGGNFGGFRRGYVGPAIGFGFRGGGYPYRYPYYGGYSRYRGYPYYRGPSVVFAPPVYYPPSVRVLEVERPLAQIAPPATAQAAAPPPAFVYYCESERGFYPWVKECDEAWLEIPASPSPPGTPEAFEPPLSAEDLPPPPGAE